MSKSWYPAFIENFESLIEPLNLTPDQLNPITDYVIQSLKTRYDEGIAEGIKYAVLSMKEEKRIHYEEMAKRLIQQCGLS